ncbi:MAG: PepSY domain-containing protein [Alphaproteobacteria bacterium]|nr:PepSY domain-containing protein [Alphaproteobacteria bacterium]
MRKLDTLAAIVGALMIGSVAARADKPGADWMSQEQVTQKLTGMGYSHVSGLEADDGHWEGYAVHNGKIVKFHADPKTGAILSEKPK